MVGIRLFPFGPRPIFWWRTVSFRECNYHCPLLIPFSLAGTLALGEDGPLRFDWWFMDLMSGPKTGDWSDSVKKLLFFLMLKVTKSTRSVCFKHKFKKKECEIYNTCMFKDCFEGNLSSRAHWQRTPRILGERSSAKLPHQSLSRKVT